MLLEVAPNQDGSAINSRRFGNYLSKYRDKVAGVYRLEHAGDRQRAMLWRVKPTGESEFSEFREFGQTQAKNFASDDIKNKRDNAKNIVEVGENSRNSHNSHSLPANADPADAKIPTHSNECVGVASALATTFWFILKDGTRVGKRFDEAVPLSVAEMTGRKSSGYAFSHVEVQEGQS